jgi:hypothetical protein
MERIHGRTHGYVDGPVTCHALMVDRDVDVVVLVSLHVVERAASRIHLLGLLRIQ